MPKRLKTFIMQAFVFAALLLTGLGVQASPVVPAESVHLQERMMDVDSGMAASCDGMTSTSSATADSESSATDCDMDTQNCHSACANCQAASDGSPAIGRAIVTNPAASETLAAIAAQYPIDHPPKLLFSL